MTDTKKFPEDAWIFIGSDFASLGLWQTEKCNSTFQSSYKRNALWNIYFPTSLKCAKQKSVKFISIHACQSYLISRCSILKQVFTPRSWESINLLKPHGAELMEINSSLKFSPNADICSEMWNAAEQQQLQHNLSLDFIFAFQNKRKWASCQSR